MDKTQFIDNIFQSPFDGVIVSYPILFDTSTNPIRDDFLAFKVREYDEYGNHQYYKVVFLIDKKAEPQNIPIEYGEKSELLANTVWHNEEILMDGTIVKLDSCHKVFRLAFNEDFTFRQYYGETRKKCSTTSMHEDVEVGVEGNAETFFRYSNKIQGHYIKKVTGLWRKREDVLHFEDMHGRSIRSFKILKISEDELELKLIDHEYVIKMKKEH